MRSLIILIYVVLMSTSIYSQHTINGWTKLACKVDLSDKWYIGGDLQHRSRISMPHSLQDRRLLHSGSTWVGYHLNEDIKFNFSPAGYYAHYVKRASDELVAVDVVKEWRVNVSMDLKHHIKRFTIHDRSTVDYRNFDVSSRDHFRLRELLDISFALNRHFDIGIYDELFINLTGRGHGPLLDQDRLGAYIEWHLTERIDVDFGYMHNERLSNVTNIHEPEHNILLRTAMHI